MQLDFRTPPGFDRTRNAEIGNKNFKLEHLEEAFTSEHWLVRIYRVKPESNRTKKNMKSPSKRYVTKKVTCHSLSILTNFDFRLDVRYFLKESQLLIAA